MVKSGISYLVPPSQSPMGEVDWVISRLTLKSSPYLMGFVSSLLLWLLGRYYRLEAAGQLEPLEVTGTQIL